MREYTYEELEIGQNESFTKEITAEMENAFRSITGDENPLHKDDGFAGEISGGKYSSHVTFGMLTASLYSTLAGMYLPGKYSLIHSFDRIDFRKPVFVGDVLTVSGTIHEKQDDLSLIIIDALIKNQNGKVVSKAAMKVIVQR
ncbi:MaoC/PaaZ C-terminal domain-containing protein [Butyrivibrio sp. XPD2002]|uniref:MaoC/PaaZ C-terminal domain-containing protein n=1 Tax=Butyrivibrio sp. XPD2002 TaxID=1280665 RepID=UPI00041053CF|nr:MaoC/PaaZ C-terminal domain-containing protein [Butyrivibrio sp. XPD2002]